MSKKQWKNIDLTLQFSTKTDWSQEEPDAPLSDVNSIRSSLPTKTNATRQTAELDNIPENGPFILNFANMSFDASEIDLRNFFRNFEIVHVEINSPRRGCGHIEFTNISDLAGAWKLNEKTFINRPLRLSIPLKEDMARQQNMGTKQKYQTQQKPLTSNSDESDNWRVKKPQAPSQKESAPANKEGAQSNWRSKVTDNASETSPAEQSNWRSKPTQRAGTAENSSSESSAWRNKPSEVKTAWKTPVAPTAREGGGGEDFVKSRQTVPRMTEIKVADDEVWRKTKDTATVATVATVIKENDSVSALPTVKIVSESTNQIDDHPSDGKKKSIFGDAKPIDTTAKDLEIEIKIEHKKLTTADVPKSSLESSSVSKPNIIRYSNKKFSSSSAESIDNKSDWRHKPSATPNHSRLPNNDVPVESSSPKKPQDTMTTAAQQVPPPPPPIVNVWEQRLKTKKTNSNETEKKVNVNSTDCKDLEKVDNLGRKDGGSGNSWRKEEACVDNNSGVGEDQKTVVLCAEGGAVPCAEGGAVPVSPDSGGGSKVVVISANGPFIDPKVHHRTQQHCTTDTKTPTAVPLNSVSTTASKAAAQSPLAVATAVGVAATTTTIISPVSSSGSSWAKGPPKSLLSANLQKSS